MFLLAFLPMLLVAVAYRELNRAAPDCGTTFTWGTKALGPWVGWLGGWGVAVSAIIVLANVAEIAGIYLLLFFGADDLAENPFVRVGLGCFFIVVMTYVSYRGIVLSERIQVVLVSFQFLVLVLLSVLALVKVYNGTAGEQAVMPSIEWLSPFGLEAGSVATAVILCIFIYWGWDACLAVTEETKDADHTPGRAALISTVILLATYVLVAYAVGAFAGFSEEGIGLGNEENADDVLTIVGEPVLGAIMTSVLLLTVSVSAASSTQTTILPTARGALAMAVYEAIPARFGQVHPRYKTPGFATLVMGATAIGFYLILSIDQHQCARRLDRVARAGRRVLLRHHRPRLRGLLPQDPVHQRPELLPPRSAPAARRDRHGGGLHHRVDAVHRPGVRRDLLRAARRHLRHRHRHAGARGAADDRLRRTPARLLPWRDAERRYPDPGSRHG